MNEQNMTWYDNWINVIRDVIFPDAKQKELMLIPAANMGNIRSFIEKYFVEDIMPDEIITDEDVRVLYYETEGTKFGNEKVTKKYLEFDIFVKNTVLNTASDDRLQRRDKLIFQRIKTLLTGERYVCNLRFTYEDDYHLGVKTVGYRRYHAVFSYKQTA